MGVGGTEVGVGQLFSSGHGVAVDGTTVGVGVGGIGVAVGGTGVGVGGGGGGGGLSFGTGNGCGIGVAVGFAGTLVTVAGTIAVEAPVTVRVVRASSVGVGVRCATFCGVAKALPRRIRLTIRTIPAPLTAKSSVLREAGSARNVSRMLFSITP